MTALQVRLSTGTDVRPKLYRDPATTCQAMAGVDGLVCDLPIHDAGTWHYDAEYQAEWREVPT